jgi:hypothetical protein
MLPLTTVGVTVTVATGVCVGTGDFVASLPDGTSVAPKVPSGFGVSREPVCPAVVCGASVTVKSCPGDSVSVTDDVSGAFVSCDDTSVADGVFVPETGASVTSAGTFVTVGVLVVTAAASVVAGVLVEVGVFVVAGAAVDGAFVVGVTPFSASSCAR